MKKFTYILILLIYSTTLLTKAQNQEENSKKLKTDKITFLSNKIDLSVKEAQDFWPLYNEYEKTIDELIKEEIQIKEDLKTDTKHMSTKDIEDKINRIFEIKESKLKLEIEYFNKFKIALPLEKISILYSSEIEFRKNLIKKYLNQK